MISTRVVATTVAGASLIPTRTWIWGLLSQVLVAIAHWIVHRIEFAAAELILKTQLLITLSSYIPTFAHIASLAVALVVSLGYFGGGLCQLIWTTLKIFIHLWIALHTCIVETTLLVLCSVESTGLAQAESSIKRSDHSALTWSFSMEAGSFVLISRADEWDEVLLVTHGEGSEWLCYSTSVDGGRFIWTIFRMTLGNFRVVDGRDGGRTAPAGIPGHLVNWMCDPTNIGQKWAPSPAQLVNLVSEGRVIMDIVNTDPTPPPRHVAGAAAELAELTAPRQAQVVPAGPAAPVQAGQSSQGIGPAEALQGPDHLELKRLAEVVNSLKSELDGSKGSKKKKKDKKKKSKKSRSRSSDHKKRKSKKRSSSSTSSSSSGRSSSSSSFVKWKMEGRSKDVTAVSMGKVDAKKFKKRADLLIFAAKHPGALTANFINALRQKLMRGGILRTSQLRDIEMTEFITTGAAGLKEVRDRREALTILQAMDLVNKREVAKAMDVLSMRITALLEAKSSGGSWDKASRKELIPEDGGSLAPSGLTGLV